jgi:hypothetical protein
MAIGTTQIGSMVARVVTHMDIARHLPPVAGGVADIALAGGNEMPAWQVILMTTAATAHYIPVIDTKHR